MNNSFKDRDGWIWLDGSFIKWRDANTHVKSQGLHYASTVFEGERAYKGKIFKSKEHTDRLFKSAAIMGIEVPYSKDVINEAKDALLKQGLKELKSSRTRHWIFFGMGSRPESSLKFLKVLELPRTFKNFQAPEGS